jgi:Ser/Thr protein kinase RdoA (MazF antagonist)
VTPAQIGARWSRRVDPATARPLGGGLINETFVLDGPEGRVVLQRLHPLWTEAVCEDIEAVTDHLAARGLVTPRLLRTDDGARAVTDEEGRVWRATSFVDDAVTLHRLAEPAQARAAGALVGRVHVALDSLEHDYRFTRGLVHDTAHHVAALRDALDAHAGHRLVGEVRAIADPLLERAAVMPDLSPLPLRHAHGDLKISNLLFDSAGAGLCLVDLDTLARMRWPHEMGDAMRSWCNPGGEDQGEVRFDVPLFSAAMAGYASEAGALITPPERAALLDGIASICLELSARFLKDALEESYFGWDAQRFASRGEHNLVRARGQWALRASVEEQRAAAQAALDDAFASAG